MSPVVLVGASTGGTEALRVLLGAWPAHGPPVLVVQHMPGSFTAAFASRLNDACRIEVRQARGGEPVLPGHAYIAPGDAHLLLRPWGAGYVTALSQAPPLNRHRPSVDMLFQSGARCAGAHVVGALLTGMGKDGAAGLLALKRAGAATFAQDEASSVVFGMPREAVALGAADAVVPISAMAGRVLAALAQRCPGGRRAGG